MTGFWDFKLAGAPPLLSLVVRRGEGKRMATLRFEVSVNGQRVCVAGLDGAGWTELAVMSDHWPQRFGPAELRENPSLGAEDTLRVSAITDDHEDLQWVIQQIRAGDEIVIRVLPAGPSDRPATREFEPHDEG